MPNRGTPTIGTIILNNLIEKQEFLGVTDQSFARLLVVNRATWQRNRQSMRLWPGVARAAREVFAELRPYCDIFLAESANAVSGIVSADDDERDLAPV